MQNKSRLAIVALAITAGAVFSGVPWHRSEEALGRTAELERRLDGLEGGQSWRFPQLIRYTARGDMVDIDLETTRLPGEDSWSWVARCNEAWDALRLPAPESVSVETDQLEAPDGEAR